MLCPLFPIQSDRRVDPGIQVRAENCVFNDSFFEKGGALMRTSRRARFVVLVPSILFVSLIAAGQTVTDTTFANSDWTLTVFPAGTGGAASATQGSNGGNFFRTITDTVNLGPSLILDTHIYTPFTYNPAVSGPIANINYSEDAFCVSGCFGQGQSTGPALIQGGNLYVFNGFLITGPLTTTQTLTASGLTAASFAKVAVTPTSYFDNTQHPDFSTAGAPIQFGFLRANSAGVGVAYTLTAAIDNWRITITPAAATAVVPTLNPFAMGGLILMLAVAGVLFLRRS
jgi:hypothetical protein